jgi:transposase
LGFYWKPPVNSVIIKFTHPFPSEACVKKKPENPKHKALREQGTLNPHPEKVDDALFKESKFFDPRDLLQIKYEMLRRVESEKKTVTEAAQSFGYSRPSFYQAQAAFTDEGLSGLVPKKRGPRGGHKINDEALKFLEECLEKEGPTSAPTLVEKIQKRFGLEVHPRTIERALARKKKPH